MVYKPMDTEAKALQGQARIYNEYSDNWEDSVREKFRYAIKEEYGRLLSMPMYEFSSFAWDAMIFELDNAGIMPPIV